MCSQPESLAQGYSEVNAIYGSNDMAITDYCYICYFCLTNVSVFFTKNKKSTEYPNLLSAMRPVPHDNSLPVLKPPETWSLDEVNAAMHETHVEKDTDPDVEPFMTG